MCSMVFIVRERQFYHSKPKHAYKLLSNCVTDQSDILLIQITGNRSMKQELSLSA